MDLNKLIETLEKHNYNFEVKNETIVVFLDFSQNVIIDFSNPSKIIISDHLENWNFLTGCIQMSLKNAFLYNFILLIFFGFFSQYAEFEGHSIINLLLALIGWILLFSLFYLIKLESFKLQFLAIAK